ncbi:di-heme oxidoredictase family protein [Devosia algicola]|uniref:Di-heme oxidoredictase family protein n=1 Tax=Devosia algicola TaxID=3026418 RepID=A0ABY7YK66_9HYPH|nr:di-heme oxidoredictase family protein [Devosia algicola]WDR01703.1 di-heme oxidoredictase family protein [Devosia algicola]
MPNQSRTFSHLISGLNSTFVAKFNYGRGIFEHQWTSSHHPDGTRTGLGPLYNGTGCAQCHVRDGRGQPPGPEAPEISGFVMQLGVATVASAALTPDPNYGWQLQDRAIDGVRPEGRVVVNYTSVPTRLGEETVQLRRPSYDVVDLAYGPLASGIRFGPRVAPPVFGLGYVSAIDPADIIANADDNDLDGDGISGRPNFVTDPVSGKAQLGRFGWKASEPSIRAQAQRAAAIDIGLSSPDHLSPYGDCMATQAICDADKTGKPEP